MQTNLDSQIKEYAAAQTSFPIELSKVFTFLGYSRKDVAKRALISNFLKDTDYITKKVKVSRNVGGSIREDVYLSKECFKSFCLISGKKESREIRKKFIGFEKELEKSAPIQQVKKDLEKLIELDAPLITERAIQSEIISLLSHTGRHFQQEVVVKNTLNTATHTRRFDFVEFHERYNKATLYEIKKNALTLEDVSATLGTKGYLALAEQHPQFRNRKLNLVFIAESITPEAQRLLKEMGRVSFIKISDFSLILLNEIKEKAKAECPAQYKWFIEQRILPYYPLTLPRKAA